MNNIFLGGENDIFKNSAVLCCGPASFCNFWASFLAAASAFFLAFSALPSSDAKYLNSALIASCPLKWLKSELIGGPFFWGGGGGGGPGGPGGPTGFISCIVSFLLGNGVSGNLGIMLSLE